MVRELSQSYTRTPFCNPMMWFYPAFHLCQLGNTPQSNAANISCKQGVPQTTPAASKLGTLVIDVNRHTSHYSPLIEFNMHVFRFVAKGSPVLLRSVTPFTLRVANLSHRWVLRRCVPAYLLSLVLVGAITTSVHASRWGGGGRARSGREAFATQFSKIC